MAISLDRHDCRILDMVQDDSRMTHAQIGDRVGLSPSSVRRRLETLRKTGVIRSEVALIDPDALGDSVLLVVLVTFERECVASHDAFRRAMVKCPEVLQCYSIGGQFDFVLIVKASSPKAYEEWSSRVIGPLADIRRLDAFVVWSTVKFVTKLPLAESSSVSER
jgi:Lrp/AsnC family leucine-responsive transcriptional regulator